MGDILGNIAGGAAQGSSFGGWGAAIGGGIGLLSGLFKGGLGKKQTNLAGQINPNLPEYQISPYAKQSLGMAQGMFNGRMAGAAAAQDKILRSQANTIGAAERNATDASQLLAVGSAAQGNTDDALVNLATAEGQNKQGLLGNLQSAYNQLTSENNKVYEGQMAKYGIDNKAKSDLMTAGINNQYGAANDTASLLALLGQSGAFNFGKKGIGSGMGSGYQFGGASNPALANSLMRTPKFGG